MQEMQEKENKTLAAGLRACLSCYPGAAYLGRFFKGIEKETNLPIYCKVISNISRDSENMVSVLCFFEDPVIYIPHPVLVDNKMNGSYEYALLEINEIPIKEFKYMKEIKEEDFNIALYKFIEKVDKLKGEEE